MDRFIGRMLDNRYEILEIIGTGGMAVVYKARCHRLNRLVAIKILKDEYSQDEEFRRRFHAEGQAVAMLSHANIVQVFDVSSSDEADYIVMELIDGITLKQYMEQKGTLNWKETLHFGIQIAKALEHAHSRGIVHRDIKPHNVMVLKNGSVKVADFGIAQVMSKTSTLTKEALGSVHYISPEQAKGGRVDNRSDIYSLGVVMYEMITGRPPYDGETPVAVAIKHINGGAVMPSVWNPNLPTGLEQIIMKAMAHDLSARYASASDMLQDMEAFRQEPSMVFGPAARPRPAQQPARPVQNQQAVVRPAQTAAPVRRSPQQVQKRREETQNRMATIAIVFCAIVAVMAIGIFLWSLQQSGGTDATVSLVEVPGLVGKRYDNLPSYPDITIILDDNTYDDTYEKGQIIRQNPLAGDRVVPGTRVSVVVSLGKEPEIKTMENLIGVDIQQAEQILNAQNLNLQVITREEFSEDYEAGLVIRTEPEAEVALTEGQTVSLWVSKGKEIEIGRMPNVVGQKIDTATKTLINNGFKNIETDMVDSFEAEGTVVEQSIPRYESVDVTTVVVLKVSKGLKAPSTEATTLPTTEVTTQPTTAATTMPGTATCEVSFAMPASTEAFSLSIRQNGVALMPDIQVAAGAKSVTVSLTGAGLQSYDIFINNEFVMTQEVDFGANG